MCTMVEAGRACNKKSRVKSNQEILNSTTCAKRKRLTDLSDLTAKVYDITKRGHSAGLFFQLLKYFEFPAAMHRG